MAERKRFDSWKEIAAYLRRGARTVQRWEHEAALPVHRLQHDKLGSVYAYQDELDRWWESRRSTIEATEPLADSSHEITLAVLPFSDLTREKDQDYLCEGLAEELIQTLAKIHGLRVASRSASFRYRNGASDPRETARRLRVGTLIEGSVRRAGERLRIAIEMIDASDGFQRWTESYDRAVGDVLALQQEIAACVALALQLQLSPQERAAIARTPTSDPRAHDCYLRGRMYYFRYGPRDMEYAIPLFVRAIGYDLKFALAYAGLADCWSYIYLNSNRATSVREQALWAGTKAVEMDPLCAQAHASRALALSIADLDAEAETEFRRAIELDPQLFEAHYFWGRHAFARGQAEAAVRHYEDAMRVRPEDFQVPLLCAQVYDGLNQHEEAANARLRGIEAARQHLEFNPEDVRAIYMAANGMAVLGQTARALAWVERAIEIRPGDSMLLYNAGCIYSLCGERERALDALERAARLGLTHKGWYEHDSNLDAVRDDARFARLLASLDAPAPATVVE
jgi:TolB-like protein/Tfp pilus assembly protein PilF